MLNLRQHSYEEIREVVMDLLLNPLPDSVTHHTPGQWANLLVSVGIVFFRREGREPYPSDGERGGEASARVSK